MASADAFGGQSTTLGQTLTVVPSDSMAAFLPSQAWNHLEALVNMKLYSGDLGIVDGAFAGDVIFGSIFASRAAINVTEIEGGDDELGVVVPSGYALVLRSKCGSSMLRLSLHRWHLSTA